MPRPRFSEMLVTRRRQLGLSISQASQVLRLKEQVLIAFEESYPGMYGELSKIFPDYAAVAVYVIVQRMPARDKDDPLRLDTV